MNRFQFSSKFWGILSFLLTCMVAMIVFRNTLFFQGVLVDEAYYVAAGGAVLAGVDPRSVEGWYYSLPAAYMFAAGLRCLGEGHMLMCLRVLNLVGVVGWFTVTAGILAGRRRWLTLPLTLGGACFLPHSPYSFGLGNVTGVLLFPLLGAMYARRWWVRVLLLSIGAPLKPLALCPALTRRWFELALPLVCMAVAVLTAGHVDEVRILSSGNPAFARIFVLAGIPWEIGSLVAIGFTPFIARGSWTRGLCLGWLSLPIAWHHTSILLFLPVACAWRRWADEEPSQWRTPALLGVVLIFSVTNNAHAFMPPDDPYFLWICGIPAGAVIFLLFLTRDPPSLRR